MELTHFNEAGFARMTDVSEKPKTAREATARAVVTLNAETFALAVGGKMKKGNVLAVAQVAGIMAAKRTPDIIPMCHPVALTGVDIAFFPDASSGDIAIEATARCTGETGVEMEALTAASAAALTIYDMCKAAQRDIVIGEIRLLRKTGGKSGEYVWQAQKQEKMQNERIIH
ncbi:MAG: cyclic pyranopterin monophosphate synthase MoaC [Oscillospiraceae bacterium]|nr:cyclic pyranopterin monophosphate synthase MoaC [Oscillospiraceae bacterium]